MLQCVFNEKENRKKTYMKLCSLEKTSPYKGMFVAGFFVFLFFYFFPQLHKTVFLKSMSVWCTGGEGGVGVV